MNQQDNKFCKDCQFFEPTHQNPVWGTCLIDQINDIGIIEVKADHGCASWAGDEDA